MADLPFQQLTVIGLGLIGGSLAMAVRERFPDWRIEAVDSSPEALQYALKSGIVDQAHLDLPAALEEGQLVVLAAHLAPNLGILEKIAPLVGEKNILVIDIGSCKRQISERGRELLPRHFIAAHPMAGKEFSGIDHATPLLFAGKSFLICPHADTDPGRLEALKSFVETLGAIPRLIDAERHDRYMAYVSHMPQLYAILLTNLLYRHEPGHLLAYHGGGLDDQLRLSASPYGMWGQVFGQNGDNLAEVLRELRGLIDEVLPLLSAEPAAQARLQSWFERSNEIHRQFQLMRRNR